MLIIELIGNYQKQQQVVERTISDLEHKDMQEDLRDPKDNPCWKGYYPVGTKKKNGRTVPNCVPKPKK
jgi:hypothetical protein